MAKKNQLVKGQVFFDFCLDKSNYVVQSNDLVGGKQSLKLNSAKIIRSCIMQSVSEDTELKPYIITIPELANLLDIPQNNLYRDIIEITNDIMKNPVFVKDIQKDKIRWIAIPWVSFIEYNSSIGVCIQLNEKLKPYLLQLKANYTQYTLDEVLTMQSVYAIRIYELIQSRIKQKILPREGISVQFTLEELKEACGIENQQAYKTFANLRIKVLDVAKKEINEKTMYNMSYEYIKQSRKVVGINFIINNIYH
jgi:plasmid replication initiation protein